MPRTARAPRLLAALLSALAVPSLALAQSAVGDSAFAKTFASATLEQCATATAPQTERSATFSGEMTTIHNTARMEMQIDVEELGGRETQYRTVTAPGLGVWQRSNAGVKDFTHIQQVTNLSAPALYRGAVRFRWLNVRGRVIKAEVLRTADCEQPASSATTGPSTAPPDKATSG